MRILFASPHCAFDRTSGAAISVTTQLEELAARGWDCCSITGTVTSGRQPVEHLLASLRLNRAGRTSQSLLLGAHRCGVEHLILPMRDTRRSFITSGDEKSLFVSAKEQMRDRRPDLLYTYGKGLLEQAIVREARRQGIATAFYLANADYGGPEPFEDADQIFTPSRALSRFYFDSMGLLTKTIGSFTRPLMLPAGRRDAVLFVNPEPAKGVAFVIEIARRCLTELPDVPFLIVESRWTKESVTRHLSIEWAQLPNVEFLPQQTDLGCAFAAARVLLFPAPAFDAAPRVIVEALHARVPVLSSSHGGAPEMLDSAGFLLDVTGDNAVVPWVECLKLLFHDQTAYTAACARASEAGKRHDLSSLADDFSTHAMNVVRNPKAFVVRSNS